VWGRRVLSRFLGTLSLSLLSCGAFEEEETVMSGLLSCVRIWRAVLVSVLGLALVVGAVSASAAVTRFGEVGEESGQVNTPTGVAVDSLGDVYVGDALNDRLDKFEGSGGWLWAAGVGVLDGASEMQTCTTSCLHGKEVGSGEALESPTGVAIDSFGDVYVVDEAHSRVLKFSPSGSFLLMFGGSVNEESKPANPDVCAAGEKCKLYATTGTGNGEFSYLPEDGRNSFIAVGPGDAVYVGDKARVEVFQSSGVWKEDISLASLAAEGRPTALAVDGSGDMFVEDAGVAGVHEFEPNGTEMSVKFDASSTTVTALAFDPVSGHLFVGDSSGGFHILEYDAVSGKELASFASKTLIGENGGLAFSGVTGELYASNSEYNGPFGEVTASYVWTIPLPPVGPAVDGESATPELRGVGTLEGSVDPEGSETSVHFEYVDDAHFKTGGYASASSTTPVSVGSGFEDQGVSAHVTLTPGTVYHFRVVAISSQGTTTGEDQTFQEIPPAQITGPYATDVAGTSVTLGAKINPLGTDTSYRLEYGTGSSYGHVVSGSVGEGMSEVAVTHHFQGLEPATEYHYRIVTDNEVGEWPSPDRVFTTQGVGGELTLPDGRAWELVSPANKHGALITPEAGEGVTKVAADGSGVAYMVTAPISEVPLGSKGTLNQVLSVRGPDGWRAQEIEVAEKLSNTEQITHEPFLFGDYSQFFSSDLSRVLVEPYAEDVEPLSSEATERTLYLRDNATGTYLPLVTPANVPPGTKFGGEQKNIGGTGAKYNGTEQNMRFVYATPDLSHIVFRSPLRLTPEAVEGHGECSQSEVPGCPMNLYEWSAGRLSLVDILPGGKALVGESSDGAYLGRESVDVFGSVSNDGRWVVWSHGDSNQTPAAYPLYVRDMVRGETWQVGGQRPRFEMMSGDASWVFYWEGSELYAYDLSTHTTTDITANHGTGEHNAGVNDGLDMAVSEDGTYVYYVATGALAPGAVSGEYNLYVSHYNGASWSTPTLIGTLSRTDEPDRLRGTLGHANFEERNYARVSPNGRYLTFMSSRPLTGYDNTDISEQETEDQVRAPGEPGELGETRVHHDEEVYLYDAATGYLSCVSCNPSGTRPDGLHVPAGHEGGFKMLIEKTTAVWTGRWLAASLPKWNTVGFGAAVYQPRYLSDSGRVFFDGMDALVPQDTNGVTDVYEYEPAGVGDCSAASVTFSRRSGGCTSLLSSGTSAQESAFMDASENGNDAFFTTVSKLVGEDYDTAYDVYSAHVCSASVPCSVAPVVPPACDSGDSCKPAPAVQPEIFGPAPSSTFSGTGNVVEGPKSVVKRSLKPKHPTKRKHKVKRKTKALHRRSPRRSTASRRSGHGHAVTGRAK
jgi:hypothetical protein